MSSLGTSSSLGARVLLGAIGVYRRWISPALPPSCRYYPTCSEYAATAVTRFGATRGLYWSARRLVTCHPFHRGGTDPVPEAFSLRRRRETGSVRLDTPLPRLVPGA